MSEVGKATVKLELDTSEFDKALAEAKAKLEAFVAEVEQTVLRLAPKGEEQSA